MSCGHLWVKMRLRWGSLCKYETKEEWHKAALRQCVMNKKCTVVVRTCSSKQCVNENKVKSIVKTIITGTELKHLVMTLKTERSQDITHKPSMWPPLWVWAGTWAGVRLLTHAMTSAVAVRLLLVLSYDFPGSFRNGKYAENNSGQERTKSGTLPVTDKDLASTYVLCRLSPTCPWFWMEREYFWSKVRKEGKLSQDSKLTMTRQVLDV